MAFVNTMDKFGDEQTLAMIIERSITEYCDDSATYIKKYAFGNCTALTTVQLPNVVEIDDAAFQGCSSLEAITNDTFPKVTSFSNYYGASSTIFGACTSLESVEWSSLERVNTPSLFKSCTALKSVNLPNFTELGSYGFGLFEGCSALKTVNLPNLVNVGVNCHSTFSGCKALESVNLPKCTTVGSNTFKDCESLHYLRLPSVTTCSGGYYFANGPSWIDLAVCTSLSGSNIIAKTKTFKGLLLRSPTVCTLDATSPFADNTTMENGTAHIYVPRALVNSYKSATNWSVWASQFRALEDYTVDGTVTGELDQTKV